MKRKLTWLLAASGLVMGAALAAAQDTQTPPEQPAATEFWPAEDYHQDYHLKNPARYRFYSTGCGRYSRLDELWGKYRKK